VVTLLQAVIISGVAAIYLIFTSPPREEPTPLPAPRPELPRPEHIRQGVPSAEPRRYSN
jgi:hypothetical protein